jgi:very-short-patch-repair endonuclease
MSHWRARSLRKHGTPAERRLWSALRDRRLLGLRFRRQHPVGPYYADFACCELKIIVEADGAHHHEARQKSYDQRRTRYLEAQGYVVIRFNNASIMRHVTACIAQIEAVARERMRSSPAEGASPAPSCARGTLSASGKGLAAEPSPSPRSGEGGTPRERRDG